MAVSAKQFSLLLLLTLLLSSDARDSQFFNKVPSTTNDAALLNNQPLNNQQQQDPTFLPEKENKQQQQQDPTFLPEKENSYGLYGHESGQNPPSTETEFKQPSHKYLPKNYNPVAYVTQPEDSTTFSQQKSFSTNPNNYNNNQNQQELDETEFRNYPAAAASTHNNANYYYNGGSSFNTAPRDTRYRPGATRTAAFQPQGMSDTRFMENGKYFYDVNADKYTTNHPYESLKGVRATNQYNNRNFYGNAADNNAYEFNRENDFQDEEESLP